MRADKERDSLLIDEIRQWSGRGVKVMRGLSVSNCESALLIQVTCSNRSIRADILRDARTGAMHMKLSKPIPGMHKQPQPPEVSADLTTLVEQMATAVLQATIRQYA